MDTQYFGVGLTKAQYRLCRDGGFQPSFLRDKGVRWYNSNKEQLRYKNKGDDPATPEQLKYIQDEGIEKLIADISYGECRTVIRENEKLKGADKFYLESITEYEARYDKDNAQRNQRARSTSPRISKHRANGKLIGTPRTESETSDRIGQQETKSNKRSSENEMLRELEKEPPEVGDPRWSPAKQIAATQKSLQTKSTAMATESTDEDFFVFFERLKAAGEI